MQDGKCIAPPGTVPPRVNYPDGVSLLIEENLCISMPIAVSPVGFHIIDGKCTPPCPPGSYLHDGNAFQPRVPLEPASRWILLQRRRVLLTSSSCSVHSRILHERWRVPRHGYPGGFSLPVEENTWIFMPFVVCPIGLCMVDDKCHSTT